MEHLVLNAQGPVDGPMGIGGVGVHGHNHHPEYARPYEDDPLDDRFDGGLLSMMAGAFGGDEGGPSGGGAARARHT